ncbi:hypothetical protein [Streptomyces sp. NPDC047065]
MGLERVHSTSWGGRFFNGSNRIAATSKPATVYGDDGGTGGTAPTVTRTA